LTGKKGGAAIILNNLQIKIFHNGYELVTIVEKMRKALHNE